MCASVCCVLDHSKFPLVAPHIPTGLGQQQKYHSSVHKQSPGQVLLTCPYGAGG